MESKKKLGIGAAALVFILLFIFLTADIREPNPENLNRLEANLTDETRAANDEIFGDEKQREIAFEHTQPGVSSEVYYTVGNLKPDSTYSATLYDDYEAVDFLPTGRPQTVTVDEFGVARFTWTITQFGDYAVSEQQNDWIEATVTVK